MREHKYRAWDTVKKVMYSAEELGADQETLSVDGRGFVNVSGTSTRLSQFHTHLLPLEYTGLKDKNGKEIYEGDIIKSTSDYINWGTGEPTGKKCIETYQIIYVEATASFTTQSINSTKAAGHINKLGICQEHMGKYYEVIGNIYDNKELLDA